MLDWCQYLKDEQSGIPNDHDAYVMYIGLTAKSMEIPMKECSAYGQIDQGGGDREEAHIYEHTQ